MELTGECRIAAPRAAVWAALNDPEMLRASIPGCQSVEKKSDTEFASVVQSKIGPVSARFTGKVTLSDIDPGRGYTLTGEGQGGVAGFGKGVAKVTLEDEGAGGTLLRYTASAQVGGKLAQIGSRLVDIAAKKIADEFFATFAAKVGQAAPAQAPEARPVSAAPPPQAEAPPAPLSPAPSGNAKLWPILLVVLALIVTWLLVRG
ncbi:MAG: carbon monoxide dehydrogenase subunit G [Alphaproteobacteria bacterium]|nr:carbon monoxide dehydrogenase subunit G [Alphaproteobacteria bacterium]